MRDGAGIEQRLEVWVGEIGRGAIVGAGVLALLAAEDPTVKVEIGRGLALDGAAGDAARSVEHHRFDDCSGRTAVDAAAALGCEYYCIDAGWYTDENWWYKVGEWTPSKTRFPNGLKELTDYIRAKGMIPGIWMEIEVMGTQCAIASEKLGKGWFFERHGKASLDRDRYQLDFRNPEVRAYTRAAIDRMIIDYGIGYFKIDCCFLLHCETA